jgi:hypothetical protein
MLGTITKGSYDNTPIPDNVYLAKLVGVKEKQPPKEHPDWFPQLSWTFQLLVEGFKNRRVWGKTPSNWIADKKLDTWLKTLGISAAKGQSIRIEDLKDLHCKVIVKTEHYKDKETGEDKTFTKVTELLPLDSLDQVRIRELAIGVTATAAPVQNTPTPAPAYVSPVPTFSQPNTQAGGFVPVTTSTPIVPTVTNPVPTVINPVPTITAPATGTPTRTIPF